MGNRKGSKRGPYKHHQPPRQCAFPGCTNIFKPMNANQHYCTEDHYARCEICGDLFKVKNLSMIPRSCSPKCTRESRRRTMVSKYGVEYALQSDAFKNKCKETNMKHLGVEYPSQSKDVIEKRKKTYKERYGVDSPMRNPSVVKKLCNTVYSKYGVLYPCQTHQCRSAYSNRSRPNLYLESILRYLGLQFDLEFSIHRFIYDAHIRNTNVLIEINPTITHNSYMSPWNSPKDELYHRRKFDNAYKEGYICINIFDWNNLDVILGKCLYYQYFKIEDSGSPVLHWYRDKDKSHIIDFYRIQDFDSMIQKGYLPVYDSGYSIDFILKGEIYNGSHHYFRN